MQEKVKNRKIILLLVGVVCFYWFHSWLVSGSSEIVSNRGISFGQNIPNIIFFDLILCFLFSFFAVRIKSWGLVLMAIGGIVNLIDRIKLGYVADYWNLWNSGVYNNINDWLIFVGIILLIIEFLWKRK